MGGSISILDVGLVFLALWLIKIFIYKRNYSFPPGPRPLPLIGNLLDIPSPNQRPWETFSAWGRKWGGLVSITVPGNRIVIINSYQTAVDLLDKRGAIYSDRPSLISADIIGYSEVTPALTYGERFKEQRKMLSQTIGTQSHVDRIAPLEVYEVRRFLSRLRKDPENFVGHIKRLVGSVVFLVSHGYQVQDEGEDRFVQLSDIVTDQFAASMLPGAFLVDILPALRYLPTWIPDGGWRKRAAIYRETLIALGQEPLNWTKGRMREGTAIPSFVSRNLESGPPTPEHEQQVVATGVGLVGGGTDTSTSALHSFFLAMTLYPAVQKKAQDEIDAVVGQDRLPNFDDRSRLPYIEAIVSELFRWLPVVPNGVPHRLTEDDHYNGYQLPKGSICFPNIWGMLHDPETYSHPFEFMPERFLAHAGKKPEFDPRNIAFGFGRRVCPGIHVAEAMVYITIVHVLATMTITKAEENGKVITPVAAQTSVHMSHPVPFKCSIKPRSPNADGLITNTLSSMSPTTAH